MKKALVILFLGFVLIASGALASQVTNVEVFYQDGLTLARIDIDGTVRFSHQTEVSKDGKPFRVIVDILSATHRLGAKNFWALPECPIKGLRTSQYSVKPEKVVRLVFDMYQETIYQVASDEKSVVVSFPNPKGKLFPNWSTKEVVAKLIASRQEEKKTVSVTQVTDPQQASSKKTVTEVNAEIEKDRLASLQSTDSPVVTATLPVTKKVAVSTPKVTRPKTIALDVPEKPEIDEKTIQPETPQALVSNTETSKAPAKKQSLKAKVVASQKSTSVNTNKKFAGSVAPGVEQSAKQKVTSEPKGQIVTKPTAEKKDKSSTKSLAVQNQPETQATAKADVVNRTKEEPTKPKATVQKKSELKKELVAKPLSAEITKPKDTQLTTSKKKATTTAEKPKNQDNVNKSVLAKAEQPKKANNTKISKTSVAVTSTINDKATTTVAVKPAGTANETDVNKTKTVAKQKKPTSRFRRSPTRPTKIKGTLVAEFPKRLVIKYKARGRDPFETLINETKTYNSPIGQRVPNVEGLRLVGVIESDGMSNSALFEDQDGYGYILKEGDKVRKGYVLRVEQNRVYFQIFEYGWSRTLSLNLEEY